MTHNHRTTLSTKTKWLSTDPTHLTIDDMIKDNCLLLKSNPVYLKLKTVNSTLYRVQQHSSFNKYLNDLKDLFRRQGGWFKFMATFSQKIFKIDKQWPWWNSFHIYWGILPKYLYSVNLKTCSWINPKEKMWTSQKFQQPVMPVLYSSTVKKGDTKVSQHSFTDEVSYYCNVAAYKLRNAPIN